MFSVRNKMKYATLCAGILLLTIVAVSCDNFLTKTPNNKLTSGNFYKDEAEMNQAVIGAYAPLDNLYKRQWRFAELRSDNTIVQHTQHNKAYKFTWAMDSFTMTVANNKLQPYWNNAYNGIQRCNTVLNNVDDVHYSNSATKDQYTGEAKFLRALYYFHLVRLFGKVPLVLKQVTSPEEAFATSKVRTPVDSIYTQIIKDARDATELLPQNYSSENTGRATKGAAETLLGTVYLTRHQYPEAVDEFKKVMNLGYSLMPNYADVFEPKNKFNDEVIFAVQMEAFTDHKGVGNNLKYPFAPYNSGTKITGDNEHNPQGLNLPTWNLLNAYEFGDKRKNASIGYFVTSQNTQYGLAHDDTLLYIKKLIHPGSVKGVTSDNWPVYRYAQVLLMFAEAKNEISGPISEAYNAINKVRARAGLDPLSSGLSKSEFRKVVYHEERVELAFEDHRWFNLLRTGRAMKVMTKYGEKTKNLQFHLNEPVYVIKKYKLLYPIPTRELTTNTDWNQNSGWGG
jgi:hypothetical protein